MCSNCQCQSRPTIEVLILEGGKCPTKAHADDAGFDVYATDDITIYPGQVIRHPLNIRMKIPAGMYLSIESKSGLGAKGILVYAGVIDAGYRGIPHVVMANLHLAVASPLTLKKGSKIAQIIPHPFSTDIAMRVVDQIDTDTSRSEGGFGSTGI